MKSQKKLCLKCGKCGEALVCSNQRCPIVVHESCMPCAAYFDDTGCFYCPYCLLKLSLAECHQAREKALLARHALVSFLGTRTMNDAGHLNSSHNLKRKKPEAPTIVSRSLETLSGNKQQAEPTKGCCLGKGTVTKDDGDLTKSYHFNVKKVKGYKTGNHEMGQTLPNFRVENKRSGDCGIAYETKLRDDVLPTREHRALVSLKENLTNDNEKTAKKVEISYRGVEREKTETDFRETPCFANSLEKNEKSSKGNASQDVCFGRIQVIENFDRPAENGEVYSGRTVEGSRKAKAVVVPKRFDIESLPCGESAILSSKSDIGKTVANCYDSVAEKGQTHVGPQETSVFYVKEVNASVMPDKPDMMMDSAYQNAYHVITQVTGDSGNIQHCSRVVDNRSDDGRKIFKLPIQDAYTTREDNEFVKHENSGNSINKNEEIPKPTIQFNNGQAEEEQTREKSKEGYACLVEGNKSPIYEQLDEVIDDESRKECFPISERVENPGHADRPAEIGSNCNRSADGITTQRNALQDPVHPTRESNAAVTHELGNLTSLQPETTKKLEGFHKGVADIEQTQAELQSNRDVDKREMVEEFDSENCRSVQDECFLKHERRGRKDADQNYCLGEDHLGRTSERQKRVQIVNCLPKNTKNGSLSVSFEEFGSVDDTESCNTEYLPRRIHAGEKRQLKKNLKNDVQHEESSGCSENEIEENELSVHDKSEHKVKSINQIQQSATLSSARRRKLPWTLQEVEMLKEGVQIYSLKANKNLPWMKILEFGCHVFDGTRTPADLKDKWRNMKNTGIV